jgi:transglutaminase-like putative cysteine protease
MSYAQNKTVDNYLSIDKKALQIPEDQTNSVDLISDYIKVNFKTEKERVRAIFIWIATNINYDIENMYSVDFDNSDSAKIRVHRETPYFLKVD